MTLHRKIVASDTNALIIVSPASFIFQPIALETLGPVNFSAVEFFTVLHLTITISVSSDDKRDGCFLVQRLSTALQRCNAILLHKSFVGVTPIRPHP